VSTIAVVGAGISGLTAAFRLSAEHDVVVFEREATAGGKIHSQTLDGFVFEWGPNGFLSSAAELRALVEELGLDTALTAARASAAKRFIYWNGKLHALPAKPSAALGLSLLSPRGKLRALGELFVAKRPATSGDDESVSAFVERRFGREVAERLVAPALLGISGGDAAATGVGALFPRLPELEARYGSVIRGMIRGARTPSRLYTFAAGGMQTLTDRLAERLGGRLRCATPVRLIERHDAGWRIVHDRGEVLAGGLIVATPSDAAATLVEGFDAELARRLKRIAYAPMRVAGVAFRTPDVAPALDGFGFLAARGAGVRILGALYTSTIVPEHAPAGTAYLRVFLGGASDPGAATLDAERAKATVLADLATVLGITADPLTYHEIVWPQAIPQYGLDHRSVVNAIDERAAAHPRFALTGNAYRGLAVGECVREATAVAKRVGASVIPPAPAT
jgi:oxygen-dependent protoporphyrinogen oxidase